MKAESIHASENKPLTLFTQALTKIGGEVHAFAARDALVDWIQNILREKNVSRVALASDRFITDELGITSKSFASSEERKIIDAREDSESIAQADVGITAAWAGFADTGAVAIRSQAGERRATSLLPPTHICILREEDIYFTMDMTIEKMYEIIRSGSSSALTFIAGPSRTADIEKVLVTGVHGPKQLIVCVLKKG